MKIKKYWLEILIFLLALFLFSYKIVSSYNFDSDFGRDLLSMYEILHGKITLLGPKLSFGGYYLGPYYYYLFAPFLFLTKFEPTGVIAVNAFFFAIFISLTFYLLKNKSFVWRFVFLIWVCLSPYFLFSSRSPGNAFSYMAMLLVYLVLLIEFKRITLSVLVFFGLFSGLIFNFHPVSVLVFLPITILKIFFLKEKISQKIINLVTYFFGIMILLAPVIIFELRHGFVMTKNTFINRSYQSFTNSSNLVSIAVPSKNPILNLLVIDELLKPWLGAPFLIIGVATAIFYLMTAKKNKNQLVFWSFLTSTVLYAILLRFQVAFYYLFPLLVLTQVGFFYLVVNFNRKILIVFLIFPILVNLVKFPRYLYRLSDRQYQSMMAVVRQAALKIRLPDKSFNLVVIRETPMAILGYEYRFILRILGYRVDNEFSYRSSRQLLMISEKGKIDWQKYSSWEIAEFGQKKIKQQFCQERKCFYLFDRMIF